MLCYIHRLSDFFLYVFFTEADQVQFVSGTPDIKEKCKQAQRDTERKDLKRDTMKGRERENER